MTHMNTEDFVRTQAIVAILSPYERETAVRLTDHLTVEQIHDLAAIMATLSDGMMGETMTADLAGALTVVRTVRNAVVTVRDELYKQSK